MEKYVLAIGELLIDGITSLSVKDLSETVALNIHPGGSPGNFCRYLKRCGTNSIIVATVGNDGLGKILVQKVAKEGIDTTYINQKEAYNTSFIVVARTNGTPDFIAYRDADFHIDAISTKLIEQASILHTTAFALSKEPACINILDAFAKAHQMGIPVSVDWNYAVEIWGKQNNATQVFNQLQQYKPYFKFSLDDIERFTSKKLNKEQAMEYLNSIQASAICLTCGSDGVYYKTGTDKNWSHLPAQKIEVKNATGAGDAFWSGFISAINANATLTQAVERGVYIASIKLQDKWNEIL